MRHIYLHLFGHLFYIPERIDKLSKNTVFSLTMHYLIEVYLCWGGGYSWAISTSIHHSFSPSCYKFEAITGAAGTKEIAPSFCRKSHLA